MSRVPQYAVWLYGSHARGDFDTQSDVDLFVATDDATLLRDLEYENRLKHSKGSVSHYSWSEVEGMAEYGSLFLQHLRLEGRSLYESPRQQGRLGTILSRMGGYRLAHRDLRGFHAVLLDVERSLQSGGPDIFELSVIATVIRHASILGCWLLGRPSFSRTEPVARLVSSVGLADKITAGFPDLYRYRLFVDGRSSKEALVPMAEPARWLGVARKVVTCVEGLRDARN